MIRSVGVCLDALRSAVPVASAVLFLLLGLLPWSAPLFQGVVVLCVPVAIGYWAINRPEVFPFYWSFLLGLFQDLLLGQPLGVSAFSYLVLDLFLRGQRSFFLQQPFMVLWGVFGFLLLVIGFVQWAVAAFTLSHGPGFFGILFKSLVAALLFPLLSFFLHMIQPLVAERR